MLTDDDWADIWKEYGRWYDRKDAHYSQWVHDEARTQIAKLVDAKLREKQPDATEEPPTCS